MAYTLQIHGERRTYPVPNGLYELMSDITREVLRTRPANVIHFIAEYVEALIATKEMAKVAIEAVDDVLSGGEASIELCLNLGISLEEANRAATIIQAAFRGYMTRKKLSVEEEKGSVLTEEEVNIDKLLTKCRITYLQAVAAATKIQALWRGFVVRKKLKGLRDKSADETWNHDWLWKEFETKGVGAKDEVFYKDYLLPKKPKSQYLPRRNITIDPLHMKTLFRGFKKDYDALAESSTLVCCKADEAEEALKEDGKYSFERLGPDASEAMGEDEEEEEVSYPTYIEGEGEGGAGEGDFDYAEDMMLAKDSERRWSDEMGSVRESGEIDETEIPVETGGFGDYVQPSEIAEGDKVEETDLSEDEFEETDADEKLDQETDEQPFDRGDSPQMPAQMETDTTDEGAADAAEVGDSSEIETSSTE